MAKYNHCHSSRRLLRVNIVIPRKFQTLTQSSIASPLNPPNGNKRSVARAAPPGAPRPHARPIQHTPTAVRLPSPTGNNTVWDSDNSFPALQRLPCAALLTSSGTAPAPAQLGSDRTIGTVTHSARASCSLQAPLQTGSSGTLLQDSQLSKRPGRAFGAQDLPEFDRLTLRRSWKAPHALGFDKRLAYIFVSAKHHS